MNKKYYPYIALGAVAIVVLGFIAYKNKKQIKKEVINIENFGQKEADALASQIYQAGIKGDDVLWKTLYKQLENFGYRYVQPFGGNVAGKAVKITK